MNIQFKGKYKSINSFDWIEIPNFVVMTGPNGSGKSQLLDLINNTLTNNPTSVQRAIISGCNIKPNEVVFLKGEWELHNTSYVNLSTLQQSLGTYYSNFISGHYNYYNGHQVKLYYACQEVVQRAGKNFDQVTRDEFDKYFPEIFIEQEAQLSQKIGEVFLNYRLSEIDLKSEGMSEEEILPIIGQKPWEVLRDILKESKLPFNINDPSENGVRDGFQFRLTHQILNEEVNFNDLSSGEKVLISLVFYLYNSQEKNIFPKLLLLDEPDAHLHPSMSQQFLNVIKNVLVDKFGVRIIMTTHSPSTVILAPAESIYEMSRIEPRIRKSPSKNHSVSLLTAGLVYIGEGTRYFLVEDNDDSTFYTYIHNQLTTENYYTLDIPLVFIAASTKDKSGGKDAVKNWENKLQESGLVNVVQGLIDEDSGNEIFNGIYKIDRYSIENYLADPLVVYAALLDIEKSPEIEGVNLSLGEEYKLKSMSNELLQKIVDKIIEQVGIEIENNFKDFNSNEHERVEILFTNGVKLYYPKWLLKRRGKDIINKVYQIKFTSAVNFSSLFKSFKRLNMFPNDIAMKLEEIKMSNLNLDCNGNEIIQQQVDIDLQIK